jgi:hypothetical protein
MRRHLVLFLWLSSTMTTTEMKFNPLDSVVPLGTGQLESAW